MPDATPILSLPLILPAQAQKHVTHNEALRVLDIAVQLAVLDRTTTIPPASPIEGDCYIPATGAVDAWAGKAGQVAAWWDGAWTFLVPRDGWVAWVVAEETFLVRRGTDWSDSADLTERFARLGINAAPDATNRLSVASPAVLLNHAGAGMQLKLNKAAVADTASLLFQTAFSGRAEIGLAGEDNLSFKVSADGTTFATALSAAAATGLVTLPAGAVVTGTLTGTAVTQSAIDATAGRLTKVGDFGIGGTAPAAPANISVVPDSIAPGIYSYTTAGSTGGPAAVSNGTLLHMRRAAGIGVQMMFADWNATATNRMWLRTYLSTWTAWREVFTQGSVLGTVAQTGGIPTGAMIERGSNANGEFARFADGTQICTRTNLSVANASTALGTLFASPNAAWTFPAAFVAAPAVTGSVDNPDCFLAVAVAPTTTAVTVRALAALTKATALTIRTQAIGRWF